MNDTKNILLAWVSSLSSIFAAIETGTWITIISAIVLPMVFFTLGKTVDVLLQIYFRHREVRTGSDSDCVKCHRVIDLVTTVSSSDRVKSQGGGDPVAIAPGSDPVESREKQERNL